jgi:GGDEF domain-containing protein
MSTLKQSIFWVAFYLVAVVIVAQFDTQATPIIDFAKYFYFVAIGVVPATVFFPAISKVNVFVPMAIWGCIYLVLVQTLDRSSAPTGAFAIILLEFILVEAGTWLAYQVALGISHAESLMDALALSAFPNNVHDIELEGQRIKIELTRSRRYHRPLGLLIIQSQTDEQQVTREMLKSVHHDLMNRFTTARIGQIIDDRIRQTDLMLKDSHGRFAILCPETDVNGIAILAERIVQAVKERTSLQISWGVATFPDDALTFDDLLLKARERLKDSASAPKEQIAALNSADQGSRI